MFSWGSTQPIPPFKGKPIQPTPPPELSSAATQNPPASVNGITFDALYDSMELPANNNISYQQDNDNLGLAVGRLDGNIIIFATRGTNGGISEIRIVQRLNDGKLQQIALTIDPNVTPTPINNPTFSILRSGGKKRGRKSGTRKNNKK